MPENIQMICLVRLIVAAVCGLLIGVEFKHSAVGYVKELIAHGVLAKETHENTIRFAPPIVISYEQMDDACNRIAQVFSK